VSRAAVFVDGAYLDFTLRDEFGGARIAYEKLAPALVPAGVELLRVYYYCCGPWQADPPTQDQRLRKARFDRFEASLQALPRFEVRRGELAYRGLDHAGKPRFEQKMVDILLGVDLVRLAAKGQISDAVVVAGDSDFVPAIRAAKDEGVLIKLVHGRSPQRAITAIADERVRIDQPLIDRLRRAAGAALEI
jgi:uncharacterized LabA/DUF88 family protein